MLVAIATDSDHVVHTGALGGEGGREVGVSLGDEGATLGLYLKAVGTLPVEVSWECTGEETG